MEFISNLSWIFSRNTCWKFLLQLFFVVFLQFLLELVLEVLPKIILEFLLESIADVEIFLVFFLEFLWSSSWSFSWYSLEVALGIPHVIFPEISYYSLEIDLIMSLKKSLFFVKYILGYDMELLQQLLLEFSCNSFWSPPGVPFEIRPGLPSEILPAILLLISLRFIAGNPLKISRTNLFRIFSGNLLGTPENPFEIPPPNIGECLLNSFLEYLLKFLWEFIWQGLLENRLEILPGINL